MLRYSSCFYGLAFLCFFFVSCKDQDQKKDTPPEPTETLFSLLPPEETNVLFQNSLEENLNVNVLMYEYLYNGGGVAVGDFNQDNLDDLYFTSNIGDNRFYINQGDFNFMDATAISKNQGRSGPWKTGVTTVDINGDNKLDLYICYSGALPSHKRKNQLFINLGNNEQGIPIFEEQAEKYGLASEAFSNQAYFFDYDQDGDLDALLLNHNPKSLPILNEVMTKKMLEVDDTLKGLRLYKNDKGYFRDVTTSSGINGSELSYGLGLGLSDINNDGLLDFYVSNDYAIPDYLYLNNGNGTFTNTLHTSIGHNSEFSMGNNISDVNNDGWQDIITLDMLPEDNARQKLLLAPDNYEKFDLNIRSGFHYQYMRNMLQLNNGNGTFSEIGQIAGISNTDWSWAPLVADFDNDGLKDLYVTNGYLKDYTNLDFINYMENYVQQKGKLKREDVLKIIQKMPSSDVSNYMFLNENGINFKDVTKKFGLKKASNSNGAAYADLDNDGDLDLIVNNINQPAFIYKNNTAANNHLKIKLIGEGGNTAGIGTKITLYDNNNIQVVEQITSRGYLSSVTDKIHFGLNSIDKIDSLRVEWNGGKQKVYYNIPANNTIYIKEKDAAKDLPQKIKKESPWFSETTSPIAQVCSSNDINDFKRQPLLISKISNLSPTLLKGDLNNDGLEDVFIGGAKNESATIYLQKKKGTFKKIPNKAIEDDKIHEDGKAALFDANNDGYIDLLVTSAGYHSYKNTSVELQDRLYLGDGKGTFTRKEKAIPFLAGSKGTVAINDINNDGFPDVFIGGRVVPGEYPIIPESYILINDGHGNFENQTSTIAPELKNLGIITDAIWVDLDNDTEKELVVVGEWTPVSIFKLEQGKLTNRTTSFIQSNLSGWWNTINTGDFNNDGKPDLIIGNMGTNTQFKVSKEEPATLLYADFDKNGGIDPIFSFYIQGQSFPYITRDEMLGQLSHLKSKFNSYASYANASINDILSEKELEQAQIHSANHMETTLLLSTPENTLELGSLPIEAQYSPVNTSLVEDIDLDGNTDLLLFGNSSQYKLRLGKFDANYGTLLLGDGNGNFSYVPQRESGFSISGEVQSAIKIKDLLLIGIHNQALGAYIYNANKFQSQPNKN
ncbi:RNA-binding protein [Zobellia sp. OII3]|uniref:VCBS repeat-containing protein n=1 Tax=Zobellia sp. OII3 TaxID=2034520 RepID=UPI000B52F10B|nr:VCBS repeat-containing protein [Zobellia sp. OII3]OWW23696.1 RNA-binding protein [Zobellia sp. OII3]